MSRCSACGAQVTWAITVTGRRMPLDPEPAPAGNVLIAEDGRAVVVGPGARVHPSALRYQPHFATCPNPLGPRSP